METLETSFQLFEIVEDGQMFEPLKRVNSISGKWMQVERYADDEDGTFPRVSDYIRLINKIEEEGVTALLRRMAGEKNPLKIDIGYCKIVRQSKHDSGATLIFKEPINIVFGKVGEDYVTRLANHITGTFEIEWFWMKGIRRQDKYANGFELYFDCKSFDLI